MAHCEGPGCTSVAGAKVIITPFGNPVVCDTHADALHEVWKQGAARSPGDRLRVLWVLYAMRYGPSEHAERVRWLEGRPAAQAA